ncbi:hypothetical protein HMPREF3198_02097 [Winkia neuii]|nr:hypothetical protein HMPREF3198_02097 [Winkia neuii]
MQATTQTPLFARTRVGEKYCPQSTSARGLAPGLLAQSPHPIFRSAFPGRGRAQQWPGGSPACRQVGAPGHSVTNRRNAY